MAHSSKAHTSGKFVTGWKLSFFGLVGLRRSSLLGTMSLADATCQTWLIGNTVADTLIAITMLYHVKTYVLWMRRELTIGLREIYS
jgi:hypothetical protein